MTLANFAEVPRMGNQFAVVLGNRENVTPRDRWAAWHDIVARVSL